MLMIHICLPRGFLDREEQDQFWKTLNHPEGILKHTYVVSWLCYIAKYNKCTQEYFVKFWVGLKLNVFTVALSNGQDLILRAFVHVKG